MTTTQTVKWTLKHPSPEQLLRPEIGDLTPEQLLRPEIGDLIHGGKKWLMPFDRAQYDQMDVLDLVLISYHGWEALRKLRISLRELDTKSKHRCPCSKLEYHGILPMFLMAKDLEAYRDDIRAAVPDYRFEMAMDSDFNKHMRKHQDDLLELDRIRDVLLGTGYTDCTLPSDGHGSLVNACLLLDNDDLVACKTWVWFNK